MKCLCKNHHWIMTLVIVLVMLAGCGGKPLTDADDNTYSTVVIGNQEWMAENLRVTRLNDGTPIELVTENELWMSLVVPGYCWYENEENPYGQHFGALYNWYAVSTGKLCPEGWRVPDDNDWSVLADFLGGDINAGGKLKDIDRTYWVPPNSEATNEAGFYARAGGHRSHLGRFGYRGFDGYWWTSTEISADRAMSRHLAYNFSNLGRPGTRKSEGLYVRCMRDVE